MKYIFRNLIFLLIPLFFLLNTEPVSAQWYKDYEKGIEKLKRVDYAGAATYFQKCISIKNKDSKRMRTYGMHFIEYFPHRQLGICYYYLNKFDDAERELNLSMMDEASSEASAYLQKLKNKSRDKIVKKLIEDPQKKSIEPEPGKSKLIVGKKTIKLVGERLSIAVFPFENKGASKDLGEIILDKMVTALHNQNRFKIMERWQLQKVLNEQSLGAAGVLDPATAAAIGKGIGVNTIILGSVAATTSGAISVDARVVDTESAAIIVAHDVYSGSSDVRSVQNTIENLAKKISESLPLIEGYVIRITGESVVLDKGRNAGLNKGMQCVIYKEGAEIKHPITGEVLGKETDIMGEILISESFEKHSVAIVIKSNSNLISIGDKFLTK